MSGARADIARPEKPSVGYREVAVNTDIARQAKISPPPFGDRQAVA
jgi:hypothetical protein